MHFGQAELRAGDRDPVMRRQRDFESAAKRRAVYRRDDGLLATLDAVAHLRQRRRHGGLAELANVRARDEVPARADDQHRAHGGICIGGFDCIDETAPHGSVECVDGRMVDRHDKDAAA